MPASLRPAALLSLLAIAAASGCAAPASVPDDEPIAGTSDALERGAGGIVVDQPQGAYQATLTAFGSGCPEGTWAAEVSPDGQTFTITFSAYEVQVSPGVWGDFKECSVLLSLRDPGGRPIAFGVGAVFHQGYVLLDQPGMRAARTAGYAFNVDGRSAGVLPTRQNQIPGPFEMSYTLPDPIVNSWGKCGAVSSLIMNTSLMVQNNPQMTGSGYLNGSAIDGTVRVSFPLLWRRC